MHLIDLLSWRSTPAAGVSIGLTRRCPLHCAHCSTSSTPHSEEHPAALFERFVDSFSVDCRPEVLSMSGGEAMLRPGLVRSLAERARRAGTKTSVLSGLFFARFAAIPAGIKAAIEAVDHFSVSLDEFHEREVPRADVFRVLEQVLARGTHVSMHLVGHGAEDPYVEGLVADVRLRFGAQVPMLVNNVSHFGRARTWLRRKDGARLPQADANPCMMAAWPVVGFDGRIAACGNDDAMDHLPAHLRLGHAAEDSWATIRDRTRASSMMRALRLLGPEYVAERYQSEARGCSGYCGTCLGLSGDAVLMDRVDALMSRPTAAVLEETASALQQQAGALAFLRRYTIPRYAELATLGAPV
ncbi:MAG: radical SAM protein [Polyangiales bacterium]